MNKWVKEQLLIIVFILLFLDYLKKIFTLSFLQTIIQTLRCSFSILTGLTSIDIRKLKHVGIHAMVYYLSTTLIAVTLGIFLVVTIRPGDPDTLKANQKLIETFSKAHQALQASQPKVSTLDTFLDLIRFLP